jgi:hypothetical protein
MTEPMHDDTHATGTGMPDEPIPGDTAGWQSDASASDTAGGREWMSQLQKMIDNVATQATPIARQIAAKAAELAAVAAEKAGPAMHRAADVTNDVGQKVAARAQQLATDLRQQVDADAAAAESSTNGHSMDDTNVGSGSTSA